jgi:hypothetical protein
MTKHTVNFFMITLESISPDARMTGILEKAIKIANARCARMAACLQSELQLTKTLPQATTKLVNSRMVANPSITER